MIVSLAAIILILCTVWNTAHVMSLRKYAHVSIYRSKNDRVTAVVLAQLTYHPREHLHTG